MSNIRLVLGILISVTGLCDRITTCCVLGLVSIVFTSFMLYVLSLTEQAAA